MSEVEKHPFTPFLPEGTKVVLCGTFPPSKEKWAMDFFYPNYYNDMWRIFGLIFFNDKNRFFSAEEKRVDKTGIMEMLAKYRIGIGETATQVIRTKGNASDKHLEIVTPVDLPALLSKIPECKVVATTGEKAASIIATLTDTPLPRMGQPVNCSVEVSPDERRDFLHWRLPSSSRAYPMALEKKAEYYRTLFSHLTII